MSDNNISFTSNIRFVSYDKFKKIACKSPNIGFELDERNIVKANQFHSYDVRTCTGGGLVNPNVEAEGFHLLDDIANRNNFAQIIEKLFTYVKNPQRGILLGSKELWKDSCSVAQFQDLKKVFLERVKNVSVFEKHMHDLSETHYHYSLDKDTWTLCSRSFEIVDKKFKSQDVKSVSDLKGFFEKISIADGDRLFIGKEEILPKDYPELFVIQ